MFEVTGDRRCTYEFGIALDKAHLIEMKREINTALELSRRQMPDGTRFPYLEGLLTALERQQ
jgi:hypothetical protein